MWIPATSNIYNVNINISRTLPSNSYFVAAFISGFSTTDTQFYLTINNKAYDVARKMVSISFYCVANPAVLTITLSYVIYPVTHPIFDFTYSLVDLGNVGSYQFSGPVSFLPNQQITYNQWFIANRYLACVGKNCTNSCVLS
jgi:hypothetical protein